MQRQILVSLGLTLAAWAIGPGTVLAEPVVSPLSQPAVGSANDYNYIGLGVNNGGLAVTSKFRLTDRFSVRPTILTDLDFGNDDDDDSDISVLVPVTYDLAPPLAADKNLLPYAGVGLGGRTRDGGSLGAVITAGADYRLSERFTANASFNWSLFDSSSADFVFSMGYSF